MNRSIVLWGTLFSVACASGAGETETTGTWGSQEVQGENTGAIGQASAVDGNAEGTPGAGTSDPLSASGGPAGGELEGALQAIAGETGTSGAAVDQANGVSLPPGANLQDEEPPQVGEQTPPSSGVAAPVVSAGGNATTPDVSTPEEATNTRKTPIPAAEEAVEEDTPSTSTATAAPAEQADAPTGDAADLTPSTSCGVASTAEVGAPADTSVMTVGPMVIRVTNVADSPLYLDWQYPWARLDYTVDGEEIVAYHRGDPFVQCSVMQTTEAPCELTGNSVLTSFTLLQDHSLGSSGMGVPYEVHHQCGACQCTEPVPLPSGPFTLTVCAYPELVCPDGETECSALTTTGPNPGAVVAGPARCQSVESTSLEVDIELR